MTKLQPTCNLIDSEETTLMYRYTLLQGLLLGHSPGKARPTESLRPGPQQDAQAESGGAALASSGQKNQTRFAFPAVGSGQLRLQLEMVK